ncbi:DUF4011 domain-containing protein [Methylocella silvestris]|uniref:DNA helicase n=1 Tax=Methylocella silvestris TaxID=199596 RepID=A0A2J7TFP2_METSI|nr:DUF4011 domain-containing protein [Methylocella silvestris]PNG25586.1 DNA helicase [Methylocella silvestris]
MGGVTSIAEARHLKKLDTRETHIERLLADARLKLVETGARNRLIHTPRGAKRTRCLPLVGAKPDPVFVNLVREGKQLRFLPVAGQEAHVKATQAKAAHAKASRPDHEAAARGGGHPGRSGLQTLLAPEVLQKRLHAIYRDGKTAEEERGVNILFLALGFLRWYEDERSDALREAPLILLPITLVRDARRSTFDLVFRDDDIVSNQALQERLRGDFAISLPDVPDAENWLPSGYFSAVATAISAKRRWSIDADAVEVGFFSSSKLLILRDLDPANWPHNSLSGHPLVRGLLRDGFASEPPLFMEDARLDEILAPQDLVQVVDADSSQTRVIESVRAGRNLIVQGPPGTGKSQTITNIIAAAAHDGKTVLFVAEKMAALNVVFDRLKNAGLGDLCLELHSHTANKRLVADRLEQTLQSAADRDFEDLKTADELAAVRSALNHVAGRLHLPVSDTGMTARQALGIQIAANARQITPDAALVKIAARWTREDYESRAQCVERLATLTAGAGPLHRHVYFGVRRSALQPADFQRLAPQMKRLAEEAGALAATASGVARFLGLQRSATLAGVSSLIGLLRVVAALPPEGLAIARAIREPATLDRVIETAKKGLDWRRRHVHFAGAFEQGIWRAPLARLRPALARGASFWPARFSKACRDSERLIRGLATAPLPKSLAGRLALVDELIRGQELASALDVESYFLRDILGGLWRGSETDFSLLHRTALTLKELALFDADLNFDRIIELARKGVAGPFADDIEANLNGLKPLVAATLQALDVDLAALFKTKTIGAIDLERLAERASQWAIHPGRFEEWARLAKADRQMRAIGPPSFADALASGALEPTRAPAMIEAAFAEATWRRAIAADPELAAFDGDRHNALIAIFRALEQRRRRAVALGVRARHQADLPRGALGAMGVVRGEIGRKRNHMPLRKLMKTAGETVQKIKPVFLMSPLSVAQYLPPGALEFDLLVIDEASQVRPGDALGVVARCRQMVIVGDKKQLPPTQFFDRMLADDVDSTDEDEATGRGGASFAPVSDLESILSLCEARGVESQMLRWHYRSRHPSLIEVSNAEFYHRLIMPLAPTSERGDKGLIVRRVAGSYDRGGLRTNLVEAEAIAAACAEHARANPELSLGVITFSTAQRDLIGDCLDTRRRSDPLLEAFLRERGREDVFVKNLENVQGDERDVILISVGYGPREPGKPLDRMAFGPISSEGGERRLNVLFTRARARCEIFASFGSGDINLERATGAGPRVLKRFLQFAETGVLEEAKATGGDFESPFEANVAAAIESMGFAVESQVGSAGFRLDLAVRDPARPGRFILGVECDGATYHSALWARERDRLRQEVLEGSAGAFTASGARTGSIVATNSCASSKPRSKPHAARRVRRRRLAPQAKMRNRRPRVGLPARRDQRSAPQQSPGQSAPPFGSQPCRPPMSWRAETLSPAKPSTPWTRPISPRSPAR